jgi:hypothetical protein
VRSRENIDRARHRARVSPRRPGWVALR